MHRQNTLWQHAAGRNTRIEKPFEVSCRTLHFQLLRLVRKRAGAMQPGKRPLPADHAAAPDGASNSPSKARLVQKSLGNFFQRSAAPTPFPKSAPAPLQAKPVAKPVAATPAKRALVDDDELDALLAQAPDSFFDAPASVATSSATPEAERAPATVAQTPPAKVRPILAQQQTASPAVATPTSAAASHNSSSPARPLISPAASFAVRAAAEMSPRGTQSPVKPPPSTPPSNGASRVSGSASTPLKPPTPYRSLFTSPDGDAAESPSKPDVRAHTKWMLGSLCVRVYVCVYVCERMCLSFCLCSWVVCLIRVQDDRWLWLHEPRDKQKRKRGDPGYALYAFVCLSPMLTLSLT